MENIHTAANETKEGYQLLLNLEMIWTDYECMHGQDNYFYIRGIASFFSIVGLIIWSIYHCAYEDSMTWAGDCPPPA